eukprot:TRINITY_DN19565_c0_g1_i1.p1 TRINITY_DN19565_c0_g1~~TRINITY_DN19565_c0_g1_i1.p1  ORF type:complete len:687 (+),score=110.64 TRINITY_DN19565_c0_g1_i1:79-2139(+)
MERPKLSLDNEMVAYPQASTGYSTPMTLASTLKTSRHRKIVSIFSPPAISPIDPNLSLSLRVNGNTLMKQTPKQISQLESHKFFDLDLPSIKKVSSDGLISRFVQSPSNVTPVEKVERVEMQPPPSSRRPKFLSSGNYKHFAKSETIVNHLKKFTSVSTKNSPQKHRTRPGTVNSNTQRVRSLPRKMSIVRVSSQLKLGESQTPVELTRDETKTVRKMSVNLRGDIEQIAVPTVESNKLFMPDEKFAAEVDEGIERLNYKIRKNEEGPKSKSSRKNKGEPDLDIETYDRERQTFAVDQDKLSENEMIFLRQEFWSDMELDLNRIDVIVRRLKFFSRYPEFVRRLFIKHATLSVAKAGEIIFKQGDYGNLMYVILKGAVNVRIKKKGADGKEEERLIATLYDGGHFGELAMMGTAAKAKSNETAGYQERTKRAATIEAAEDCHFLMLPRDQFKEILMTQIQAELDSKLKVLLCIPFLENSTPFSLIPLANYLVSKFFKLGQMIIQEGVLPSEMLVVATGRVKVVRVSKEVRKKHDKWWQVKANEKRKEREDVPNGRTFENDVIWDTTNVVSYVHHVEMATLTRGMIICGRSLLIEVNKDGTVDDDEIAKLRPTKLAAVADSSIVELLSFDRKNLIYLPEQLQRSLKDGISKSKDYDDIQVDKEIAKDTQWQRLRQQTVYKMLSLIHI